MATNERATERDRGIRAVHDWSADRSITYTVLDAMSHWLDEADNGHRTVLYDSVDPDALEALFVGPDDGPREHVSVEFTHDRCTVTVDGTGEVLVRPPQHDPAPH